jgi:hypothetical protein
MNATAANLIERVLPPQSGLRQWVLTFPSPWRDPRKTPLYGLLESLYERVKGAWEERFERSHGFWRGLVDEVVKGYLACGLWPGGFARVRCRRPKRTRRLRTTASAGAGEGTESHRKRTLHLVVQM